MYGKVRSRGFRNGQTGGKQPTEVWHCILPSPVHRPPPCFRFLQNVKGTVFGTSFLSRSVTLSPTSASPLLSTSHPCAVRTGLQLHVDIGAHPIRCSSANSQPQTCPRPYPKPCPVHRVGHQLPALQLIPHPKPCPRAHPKPCPVRRGSCLQGCSFMQNVEGTVWGISSLFLSLFLTLNPALALTLNPTLYNVAHARRAAASCRTWRAQCGAELSELGVN